jgi:hypothetical protein
VPSADVSSPSHTARLKGIFHVLTRVITLARAVKPHKIRLFAEPDQLATRVTPILLDDERARFSFAAETCEHLHHLSIDETTEGSRFTRHASRQ